MVGVLLQGTISFSCCNLVYFLLRFTTEPQHEESGGDVADQDGVFAIGRLELGQLNGPVRIFARVSSDPSGPCANKILERSLSFVGYA